MLEKPDTKQDVVQRKCFIGGQQKKLEDELLTIDIFFQFPRITILFDMSNFSSYLTVLLHMSDFSELIYDNKLKDLHNKNLDMMKWLPFFLLIYLKKYVKVCNPQATNHKHLRSIIDQEPIDPMTYKEDESLFPRIIEILRPCTVGDNRGMINCTYSTYTLFYLQL